MTSTPNPTAEPLKSWDVNNEAWEAFSAEEHLTNGIQAAYEAGLRAHGLLSEGAPNEEQIERAARALFNRDNPGRGHAELSWEEVRGEYEAEARAALTAAGAAPQGPQALDAEKVAEVAEQAGDEWQWRFDQLLSETAADPGPLYPFIASALCEAYTEGKLTK